MIEELRIRDLGVIVDATLELGPGFTVITGETGAGKTMVVTALGLLMGERAAAGAVREGAAAARVSGLVRTTDAEVCELVAEVGGELDDADLTLTRTVSAEGRSKASVGGSTAPVGTLSKLASRLFAVHGQNEQLRLRSGAEQRTMLDRFGGAELLSLLVAYQEKHTARLRVAAALDELRVTRDERLSEATRLRRELDEIAAVDPLAGEDVELKLQIDRLSNIEALRAASAGALRALSSDGDAPFSADAISLIDGAAHDLERVAASDPRLAEAAEQLRSLSAQLGEVARVLLGYESDLENEGSGELVRAHERLAMLNDLLRSYGESPEAVIEYSARASVRLAELDGDDVRIGEHETELAALTELEAVCAAQLSAAREAAAAQLSVLVTDELRHLALPDARFLAQVSPVEFGSFGADEVQLLLQPHPGATPRPVAKSASGGELSRVMLAIEVVVAGADPVPTFVFDEVDAGVGGAAAIEIGRRLAVLAKTSQVIVVTHLAQVAAFASNHVQVVKDSSGGFTESSCRTLLGDARRAEIARLLSGLADSENALAHASELLAMGETS